MVTTLVSVHSQRELGNGGMRERLGVRERREDEGKGEGEGGKRGGSLRAWEVGLGGGAGRVGATAPAAREPKRRERGRALG